MTDIILIVVIAAIVGFAAYKGIKKAKGGCCSDGSYKVRRVKAENSDISSYKYKNILHIDGMTCINCKTRVENAFNRKGYYAKVDLSRKQAQVYGMEPLSEEQVAELIARDGYTVVDIRTEKL